MCRCCLGGVFKLTGNRSPAESLAGIKNKPEYERLETQRFIAPPRDHDVPPEPVLSGQHAGDSCAAPLRRRGSAIFARYVDEMFPPHVVRSRRSSTIRRCCGRRLIGIRISMAERYPGLDADAGGQGRAYREHRSARSSAAHSARPPFSSASEIFFGKDRLRDVEEAIVAAKA